MIGDLYATMGDLYGPTSGPTFDAAVIVGDANAPSTTGQAMTDAGGPALQPVQLLKGLRGINPLVGAVVLIGIALLYNFLRHHRREGQAVEARYGLFFGLAVMFWSLALDPLAKAILAKYQLPGISAYVQNA